jgi:hypothetical protein
MEFINATRMQAGYTMATERSGRELLVIVVKGTFTLPKTGEDARLHEEQLPLVLADTFTGDPGSSAPVYEVDFAPRKQACDVLLLGSAHAPQGRPASRVRVGMRVGPMAKGFDVVGDRMWSAGVAGIRPTSPKAFVQQPISYDLAFGGVDQESDNPTEHDAYRPNPVGRGFRRQLKKEWVDGKPLPNTEESGQPVTWPQDRYRPMAFGPLGRSWTGRYEHAGTYDQNWIDEVFPFLPQDFDERYFQAAPADQQVPFTQSSMDVRLSNLTPDGDRHFSLPHFEAPVHVLPRRGAREDLVATLDTIVLEPDQERFSLTWRVARPLKKNLFEIGQVMVGRRGREWWQQRGRADFPVPVVLVPTESASV